MIDEDARDLAPEDTEEVGGPSPLKRREAYKKLTRQLNDDDLKTPGALRLLLDNLDRLEAENTQLSAYREDFHAADKRVAILEEAKKTATALEVLSVGCLTVGAAAVGYASSLLASGLSGLMPLAFGSMVIVTGVAAKMVKR